MSRASGRAVAAGRSAVALLIGGLLLCVDPEPSAGWDVRCFDDRGEDCPDPFANARTPWLDDESAEHRALLLRTLQISGLPPELTGQFTLQVFAADAKVEAPGGIEYDSVAPVLFGATRTQTRELSIPGMASLPDFSYTLWDWASGNEECPPNPSNPSALDCHNYETHIGWLNSNHMLPQARKWFEHLHAIALEHARRCKREYDATPLALRERYEPYFMECERLALVTEGAAHHYLQDAWATGHMWERWGGTELADFGGNRALGFLVGSFVGLIHGAKAMADPLLRCLPGLGCEPFDDPMNAPHPRVAFIDGFGSRLLGVGDVFLPELNGLRGVGAAGQFDLQRKALLGCAVSSIREVYAAGPQVQGALAAASAGEFDTSRDHRAESCWAQRATDSAVAEGFGLHQGASPTQRRLANELLVTLIAHLDVSPARDIILGIKPDLEILAVDEPTREAFTRDAAFLTTEVLAMQAEIGAATLDNRTTLASGGMGNLAGIGPNSFYLRGDAAAKVPPSFYADPFPPWRVKGAAEIERRRSRALALTFADATAGERCEEVTVDDLERWRIEVAEAIEGGDADAVAASCGHCTRMVAPHLRHGRDGSHDGRREAYCAALGGAASAFAYTDEDAGSFTGTEPVSFEALRAAARGWCSCDDDGDDGDGGVGGVGDPRMQVVKRYAFQQWEQSGRRLSPQAPLDASRRGNFGFGFDVLNEEFYFIESTGTISGPLADHQPEPLEREQSVTFNGGGADLRTTAKYVERLSAAADGTAFAGATIQHESSCDASVTLEDEDQAVVRDCDFLGKGDDCVGIDANAYSGSSLEIAARDDISGMLNVSGQVIFTRPPDRPSIDDPAQPLATDETEYYVSIRARGADDDISISGRGSEEPGGAGSEITIPISFNSPFDGDIEIDTRAEANCSGDPDGLGTLRVRIELRVSVAVSGAP